MVGKLIQQETQNPCDSTLHSLHEITNITKVESSNIIYQFTSGGPFGSQYQQPVSYMPYSGYQPLVINPGSQQQQLLNHAQITEIDYQMEQTGGNDT